MSSVAPWASGQEGTPQNPPVRTRGHVPRRLLGTASQRACANHAGKCDSQSAGIGHFKPDKQHIKGTPILMDGIIYVTAPDNLWAVDARSARQIWHYHVSQLIMAFISVTAESPYI